MEFRNVGMLHENRVDRAPQIANAFAVNNPYLAESQSPRFI